MASLISPLRPAVFLLAALLGSGAPAQTNVRGHWVATWGASPAPSPATDELAQKNHLQFEAQTLREIVHVSLGGSVVRVRLSNVFGKDEADIGAASIAVRGGGAKPLRFNGRGSTTIPANAEAISDPVSLELPPLSDVVISLYFPKPTRGAGVHYAANQESYVVDDDATRSADWPDAGIGVRYWAFLAGVDVMAAPSAATLVTFGDSITDGSKTAVNSNHRWPDILARRLLARHGGRDVGVLNAGIGGNRVLHDTASLAAFGVSGLSRLDRDVLAQPSVRYLIVLEGINDIGHPGNSAPLAEAVSAADLIGGLRQIVDRAHECGIKVFVATLTPFEGAKIRDYYTPEKEQVRQRYNAWIRTSGVPDGVIDFDRLTRDPAHPGRYLPAYDSGDHLHPSEAGYRAMGEAIDVNWFN